MSKSSVAMEPMRELDDVGDLLRHADPRTTKRVYVHFRAIDLRQKMEALQ